MDKIRYRNIEKFELTGNSLSANMGGGGYTHFRKKPGIPFIVGKMSSINGPEKLR
jgi:hypothetical protein